jgi:gluconolactonase
MLRPSLSVLALSLLFVGGARAADPQPGPDSMPQTGVPKGEVLKFSFDRSRIFPGTYRDYWVYVPAQYRPEQPACLYVNQDGVQWQAPTVFDNLIHKKEMPVTIGVFVQHGRVRAADGNAALDRFNRSLEYDGLGDRYARFLVEELLPEVQKQRAGDGRPLRISPDPNDRAIGGSSSGAVCAFTAAWERPDQFTRVFSAIGTYVGLRGADGYPTWIRKYEPKPLRVFLQDGSGDLNIYAGDWWVANQMMERALTFAGYEVAHAWGEGGHNGNHGTAVFPDAMRFLWKGWPAPVQVGKSRNTMLADLLAPGQAWEQVATHRLIWGLCANAAGEVYFKGGTGGGPFRIRAGGKPEPVGADATGGGEQVFGPDGRLYGVTRNGRPVVGQPGEEGRPWGEPVKAQALVVAANGNAYFAQSPSEAEPYGRLWLVAPDGKRRLVENAPGSVGGLTLSPDQTLLYASDAASHWVESYQIQPDGSLSHRQQYYWLHTPDNRTGAGAGGMCVDRDGRLYVATALGVQVCDQAGRVNCILPMPTRSPVDSVCLGGEAMDTLYASSGGVLFRRKLGVKGRQAFQAANKPPAPRL